LIFVGDDDHLSSATFTPQRRRYSCQGHSKLQAGRLPGDRHSYFYTEPEKVHGMIREFLKES